LPPRFAVHRLDEIPTVPDADVDWHPLQHYFGLNTFGANLFIARGAGDQLIAEHDESESAQQELYLVLRGAVRFTLDGETHDAPAISVAAVPDNSVRRAAVALEPGATMLALGAPPGQYASTWRPAWFEAVPKLR
jgi:quercetin dioxygenase-like cupin family protein